MTNRMIAHTKTANTMNIINSFCNLSEVCVRMNGIPVKNTSTEVSAENASTIS